MRDTIEPSDGPDGSANTSLVVTTAQGLGLSDREARETLRAMYPRMTDQDERLFVLTCNRLGLDPFAKQIHAVWRRTQVGNEWKDTMAIQVGIDGFRLQAERSHKYDSQIGPFWCGEDGVWVEAWIFPTPPLAAKVGVWRKGAREPIWGVATWREYCQTKQNGEPTAMWVKMPSVMLAKCAEGIALRRALPAELSGIYSEEEMMQEDNESPPRVERPAFNPNATRATERPAQPANGQTQSHTPPAPTSGSQQPSQAPQNGQQRNPYKAGEKAEPTDHPELLRFLRFKDTVASEGFDVPLIRQTVKVGMSASTLWSLNQAIEIAIANARQTRRENGQPSTIEPPTGEFEPADNEQRDRLYDLAEQVGIETVTDPVSGERFDLSVLDWAEVNRETADLMISLLVDQATRLTTATLQQASGAAE